MQPIVHIFNSSIVSGPETLVLPNLKNIYPNIFKIILIEETRLLEKSKSVELYAQSLGYEVHKVAVRSQFDWQTISNLHKLLKKINPSIIHTHGPKASFYSLLAAQFLEKKPTLITTHHGVRANDFNKKLKVFEIIYEKCLIPFYDLVLTVCSSDRLLLNKRGIALAKIKVHLNGTDRALIDRKNKANERQQIRTSWFNAVNSNYEPSHFLVGVVARLSPEKQQDKIIVAINSLKNKYPNIKLLIFGSGHYLKNYQELTQKLALTDRVLFMGYQPNISAELYGLDLLVSFSQAEGLPINLIEAGWAGVPVIAQNVDGVADLIIQNQSGILLPDGSSALELATKIEYLYTNQDIANNLAENFQNRIKNHFSKTSWNQLLLKVYSYFLKTELTLPNQPSN